MADVQAIFGTLLALGIAFPGMLMGAWLLFPGLVARAEERILRTPGRTMAMGLVSALVLSIPILFFIALPFGPAQFVGGALLLTVLGASSLGAAGLASAMGRRFRAHLGPDVATWRSFLAGAVALELTAAFPLIGWLLFIPAVLILSLGAASLALLRWQPSRAPAEESVPAGGLAGEPQSA